MLFRAKGVSGKYKFIKKSQENEKGVWEHTLTKEIFFFALGRSVSTYQPKEGVEYYIDVYGHFSQTDEIERLKYTDYDSRFFTYLEICNICEATSSKSSTITIV